MKTEKDRNDTSYKSPWRFLFLIPLVIGAWELLGTLFVRFLYLMMPDSMLTVRGAASIGVIGGADGPTAVFVTTPGWVPVAANILLLLVGIVGFYKLSRCKKKK